ncbi:MAG TPA: membrane protein insertion efficiency factor YidD [Acidimicrobiia bacterium]|nr:membrane protein insertion efficiency factor YidD [Acidimicrobiia bacterium]
MAISGTRTSTQQRPLSALAVFLIVVYQRLLSVRLGRNCRYFPSCSQYAIEAIDLHGVFRGGLMGLRRLSRCHPLHPGGLDPVPPARTR